jgi:hypothetical protein
MHISRSYSFYHQQDQKQNGYRWNLIKFFFKKIQKRVERTKFDIDVYYYFSIIPERRRAY